MSPIDRIRKRLQSALRLVDTLFYLTQSVGYCYDRHQRREDKPRHCSNKQEYDCVNDFFSHNSQYLRHPTLWAECLEAV